MGLDMYLTARRYVGKYSESEIANNIQSAVSNNIFIPPGATVNSVKIEVGYWRKANAIHKWFVDNVQNGVDECQETYVSKKDLTILRNLCEMIIKGEGRPEALLPTTSGFFFGSTEYNEMYMQDIQDTIEIIDRALQLNDFDWDIYYQSSW